MHEKVSFIFYTTLVLYIITLMTVSYVGVYLTYVAIPIIVISGLIMKFTSPRSKKNIETDFITINDNKSVEVLHNKQNISNYSFKEKYEKDNSLTTLLKSVSIMAEETGNFIEEEINKPLKEYNTKLAFEVELKKEINELVSKKTAEHLSKLKILYKEKAIFEIKLEFLNSNSDDNTLDIKKQLEITRKEIETIKKQIETIRKECTFKVTTNRLIAKLEKLNLN